MNHYIEITSQIMISLFYFDHYWKIHNPRLEWITEQIDEKYRAPNYEIEKFPFNLEVDYYQQVPKEVYIGEKMKYQCILLAEEKDLLTYSLSPKFFPPEDLLEELIEDNPFHWNARNQLKACTFIDEIKPNDHHNRSWKRYFYLNYYRNKYHKLFWYLNHYEFETNLRISLTPKGKHFISHQLKKWNPDHSNLFLPNIWHDANPYTDEQPLSELGEEKIKEMIDEVVLLMLKKDTLHILDLVKHNSINLKQAEELALLISNELSFTDYICKSSYNDISGRERYFENYIFEYPTIKLNDRGKHYAMNYARNPKFKNSSIYNFDGQINISSDTSTINAKFDKQKSTRQ